jgi:MATE family multidrug resistance protein
MDYCKRGFASHALRYLPRMQTANTKQIEYAATADPRFRNEVRALAVLALPIIVSQLGMIGMTTADTVMVGRLGAVPLAAAGLGSAIHTFTLVICTGILLGMAPLVSQAFGASDHDRCRKILIQGLWLAALLSLPLMLTTIFGKPIAHWTGVEEDVADLTGRYLFSLTLGIPPLLLFNALRQYLEGMGRARPSMVITFIGLVVNVIGNYLLIWGVGRIPALGLVGTGYATSIGRWVMLLCTLIYIHLHPGIRPFEHVSIRPDRALLRRMMAIGAPAGAHFGLEVGLFAFAAVMMGWLGPIPLAAHQVVLNLAATTFMVALGTSIAGSIRVGQHIGAAREKSMHHAVFATYLIGVGFMALCALTFLLIPRTLIGFYTHDVAIVDVGVPLLLCAAAFQVFDGAQVAATGVLRGAADTRIPMIVALVGYWLFGLPVGYWLGFHTRLGAVGVWIGLSVGLGVVAMLLLARVRHRLLTHHT